MRGDLVKVLIIIITLVLSGCGVGYISQYNTHPIISYSEDMGRRPSLSELIEDNDAKVEKNGNFTTVTIKEEKSAWEGKVIFVLIPIPLLLPVRHDLTYTFENGVLVSKSGVHQYHEEYTGCFFIIVDEFCAIKKHR